MTICNRHRTWICVVDKKITWKELLDILKPNITNNVIDYIHIQNCVITKCPTREEVLKFTKNNFVTVRTRHWLFWKKWRRETVNHFFTVKMPKDVHAQFINSCFYASDSNHNLLNQKS